MKQDKRGNIAVIIIIMILLVCGAVWLFLDRMDSEAINIQTVPGIPEEAPQQEKIEGKPEITLNLEKEGEDIGDEAREGIKEEVVAYALGFEDTLGTVCFREEGAEFIPLTTTIAEFRESIIIDKDGNRALAPFCGAGRHLGKNLTGEWELLFATVTPLASVVVEACNIEDLIMRHGLGIENIDDGYFGGLDSETYKNSEAINEALETCRTFVEVNG